MPEESRPSAFVTILGFDFGLKRVGVALGNTVTASARPLATIDAEENDARFKAIAAWIREWQPDLLVVGRPLNAQGDVTDMTRRAERFGRQLAGRFGLPVKFCDERYSSVEAEAAIRPRREDKASVDAAAAAVILQAWLNENDNANP